MTMNRLDRIRRKLDILSSYDIEECADLDLGIKKHGFRLAPPLPELEVVAFEERYGIVLPPEYRTFVTSIGSSGAGPHYGLLPLSQATDHLNCDDEAMCKQKLRTISPLSDKVYKDDWLVEVGGANWKERRYGSESWDPFRGTMAICDQGCSYYAVLVLNGPHRGAIWNIELHLSPPRKAPYSGFLDYYEDWVDRMLAKEWQFWYGYPRTEKSNG
jgi:hypothetical protein